MSLNTTIAYAYRNVHVTLVIHPRKEEEGKSMSMQSVFGSAKMTQEADLVMILQRSGDKKSLEVKKNRYDGTVGDVALYFEKESGSLQESAYNQSVVAVR
jgi:twinkle protein